MMKLEKRSEGTPDAAPAQDSAGTTGKRPVIVYILILFIAAFLLMTLSFFMHQRSNEEVMGNLRDSVSALQEVQAMQDQVIQLQNDIQDLQEQLAVQENLVKDTQGRSAMADARTDAMIALYTLQQQYSSGNYDACKQTIEAIESTGQSELLSKEAVTDGVVSPAQRYQELKEAVMAH